MELYGYTITHNQDGWTAIKPGEVVLSISNEFLKKENGKANPLKETRLLDLIYLCLLKENAGANHGK